MVSLPPLPPTPHAEGGPAQSSLQPGDPIRELIHEVRNLQQAVVLLSKIAMPREEVNERDDMLRKETHQARKRLRNRIYLYLLLAVLSTLIALAFLVDRSVQVARDAERTCQAQATANANVQRYVAEQIAIESDNRALDPVLRQKRLVSLTNLGQAFPIPQCESSG